MRLCAEPGRRPPQYIYVKPINIAARTIPSQPTMRIAVIGGGINGIMSAWELAGRGHQVELYERSRLMGETSSASSKLLHGGLRYLEQGKFSLVREALRERAWWLNAAPTLTGIVKLFLPVYRNSPRRRVKLAAGLTLYDLLAGRKELPAHRWWPAARLPEDVLPLRRDELLGVFEFYDGRMDDRALGLWAAERAREAGVVILERHTVTRISTDGTIEFADQVARYDAVINASGPWAMQLLRDSEVESRRRLALVRGSHLVLARDIQAGLVIQHPTDGRVVFVLPFNGRTLIGTTEQSHLLSETPVCSDAERAYLIAAFNIVARDSVEPEDVLTTFSGVRALVDTGRPMAVQPREAVVERTGRLISIFGGKWTSSRSLARRVAAQTMWITPLR
jgi:glycerol-3-phosphate dehydrogenase